MTKYQLKGPQFLHLAYQGGGSPPCSPVSYATDWVNELMHIMQPKFGIANDTCMSTVPT